MSFLNEKKGREKVDGWKVHNDFIDTKSPNKGRLASKTYPGAALLLL